MAATALEEAVEHPRRLKWYALGALGGATIVAAVLVYAFSAFASTGDLEHESARTSALETRASTSESRTTKLEADREADRTERARLEEDYHFNRQQMWEIAKAVGAKSLAPPHETK